MSSVYSQRFLGGEITESAPVSVVVPAGLVWVIHSVTVAGSVSAATAMEFSVAGVPVWFGFLNPGKLDNFDADLWTGRVVANAGEAVQLGSTGNCYATVSGYSLTA